MFEKYKIKKLLKPRKEFVAQTRTTFLAVFGIVHPSSRVARGFTAVAKALIAGGTLVALLGGMSVYADTANVAADSPLYPLKRLGESVQLAVAAAPEKAQLQATFATRRANEISDLETRKPSSTAEIAGLSNDLNTAIGTSLTDAQNANLGDGQLTNFCDKVLSAIATSSIGVRANSKGGFNARAQIIGKFVNQCAADLDGDSDATSTIANGANATSTAADDASSTSPRDLFRRLFPMMPSSTIDNASGTNSDGGEGGVGGKERGRFGYRLLPGAPSSTIVGTTTTTSTPHSPFQRLLPRIEASTTINVTSSANIFGAWKKLLGD